MVERTHLEVVVLENRHLEMLIAGDGHPELVSEEVEDGYLVGADDGQLETVRVEDGLVELVVAVKVEGVGQ